jgi:dUTP pyrophosphatase
MDIYATGDVTIRAKSQTTVHTGLSWECPPGYCGLVFSRSGHAKYGVRLQNSVAVIDSDYRGEWMCIMRNDGDVDLIVRAGDRIAQVKVVPVLQTEWAEVPELNDSARGEGGFGSTGR